MKKDRGVVADLHALGRMVKAKRKSRRLTLKDAAEESGISVATLSRIELAQSSPDSATLLRLAKWLEVSFQDLAGQVPVRVADQAGLKPAPPAEEIPVHLRASRDPDPEVMEALFNIVKKINEQLRKQG